MKYKALIVDIDGTTIPNRRDGLPSAKVIEAIKKAQQKIHVSFATGRNVSLITPVLNVLPIKSPCIVCGGCQIYDPLKKKIVWEKFLNQEVVMDVYHEMKKYTEQVLLYDSNMTVALQNKIPEKPVLTIWIPAVHQKYIVAIEKYFETVPQTVIHKTTAWQEGLIDIAITHAEASKQHGVLEVSKMLHITPQEIMGVGDSYNDYSLLMASGLKFAMGNAVSEIKAAADFIAPSVDEDGVAVIIEKLILAADY